MINKKGKVFVGLSGGVDSSVVATLLKKRGFDVTGVHLRCYNVDGCGERDAEDARRVAEHLDIPFYTFDFEKEYKIRVVEYMVDGYKKGITPNPDVMCNREIKFGLFLEKALALGADYVATGHYVRIRKRGGRYELLSGKDKNKDQSYFLWTLTQNQLKHALFPIGKYQKDGVRELARKFKLPTAAKKDSQGICFLGQIKIEDFLKNYIPGKEGDVLDVNGKKIGRHNGAEFYTIGQRHGLDLKEKNTKLGITGNHKTLPHFVVGKDIKANSITVAEGENHSALYKESVVLADINLISKISDPVHVLARIRYRQALFGAELKENILYFSKPQKCIAPGQSAVFYSKRGVMLGGGIIVE